MLRFKSENDRMLFTFLNPILIHIYTDLFQWTKNQYNIDLVITETITTKDQDDNLGRVSDSHQKGIALDIRAKDIDKRIVKDIVTYINTRWQFKQYHYMARSGAMRLAYDHGEGDNYHIHLQIHQKYANNTPQFFEKLHSQIASFSQLPTH
jgi:hypothetical protein